MKILRISSTGFLLPDPNANALLRLAREETTPQLSKTPLKV
jgi:hypothetical protein